jgi:hypothetical protein
VYWAFIVEAISRATLNNTIFLITYMFSLGKIRYNRLLNQIFIWYISKKAIILQAEKKNVGGALT